jgi:hypothetical protein
MGMRPYRYIYQDSPGVVKNMFSEYYSSTIIFRNGYDVKAAANRQAGGENSRTSILITYCITYVAIYTESKVRSPVNKENHEGWRRHEPKMAFEWSRKHHSDRFNNYSFFKETDFFQSRHTWRAPTGRDSCDHSSIMAEIRCQFNNDGIGLPSC